MPQVFTIARHVLLREDGATVALIRELVDAGAITQTELDSWLLFERLRTEGKLRLGHGKDDLV